MNTSSPPVEIPLAIEVTITHALHEFAHKNGLQAVDWYHDSPVWFLERHDEDIVRRVQVSAHRSGPAATGRVTLNFIPDVSRVAANRVVASLRQDQIRASIGSLPITPESDTGVLGIDPLAFSSQLWTELENAWQAATKLPVP